MKFFLLILSFFLIMGCSDDSSGYELVDVVADKVDVAEHGESIVARLSLEGLDDLKKIGWTDNGLEQTYAFFFRVDSVLMTKLNEALTPLEKEPRLKAQIENEFLDSLKKRTVLQYVFDGAKFSTPYVQFSFYGQWVRKSGDGEVASDPVVFDFVENLGNQSEFFYDIHSFLQNKLLTCYLREEKMSLQNAQKKAAKEYNSFLDSMAIVDFLIPFLGSVLDNEHFQEYFDFFTLNIGDKEEWLKKNDFISIMDSSIKLYAYVDTSFNTALQMAYGFAPCSTSYCRDSVRNEKSRFYGNIMEFENPNWHFSLDREPESHCSHYLRNSVKIENDTNLYYCDSNQWNLVKFENTDTLADEKKFTSYFSKLLGRCQEPFSVERALGRYFRCNKDYSWQATSQIDMDLGICGGNIGLGTLGVFQDSVYVCEDSLKWKKATPLQESLFYSSSGGDCDRESDHLQLSFLDSAWYMCVDNPSEKIDYGWKKVTELDTVTTQFIEKNESFERVVYGVKYFDVMYLYTDSSFDDFYSTINVFNFIDGYLYPVIVERGLLWFAEPLVRETSVCPVSFRIPEDDEWNFFPGDRKEGTYCVKTIRRRNE